MPHMVLTDRLMPALQRLQRMWNRPCLPRLWHRARRREICGDEVLAQHLLREFVVFLPIGKAVGAAVDALRDRDELLFVGQLVQTIALPEQACSREGPVG